MNFLKYNSWAVIIKNGVEDSKAYKIIEKLRDNEYKVVGISNIDIDIEGVDIYPSLKDVPHNIDVVAIIEESLGAYLILEEMELLDIQNIWLEKDSYNEIIMKKAKDIKLNIESKLYLYEELR